MSVAVIVNWNNAAPPELVWTVIGMFGVYFKVPNILSSYKSVQAVHKLNGKNILSYRPALILAKSRFRREILRGVATLAILTVGITSSILPPACTPVAHSFSPVTVLLTVCFFMIEIIDVAQSALDKWDYNKVMGVERRETPR